MDIGDKISIFCHAMSLNNFSSKIQKWGIVQWFLPIKWSYNFHKNHLYKTTVFCLNGGRSIPRSSLYEWWLKGQQFKAKH